MRLLLALTALLATIFSPYVHCEWIPYSDPLHREAEVTFSTLSIKRADEVHYSVTVFTNYSATQEIINNRNKIQFLSKSEMQYFGCETQDFALGDTEYFRGRDATGPKMLVSPKDLIWNPIPPKALQMELLQKFCAAR